MAATVRLSLPDTLTTITMETVPMHYKKKMTAIFLLCGLFAACDEQSQPARPAAEIETKVATPAEQDTATTANATRQDTLSMKVHGTDKPFVGPKELKCVRLDHADRIRHGTTTTNYAIGSLPFQCTVKALALQKAVDDLLDCKAGGPVTHAVIVHYGLNDDFLFVPALQVQCLTYDDDEETYSLEKKDDCYLINTDGTLTYQPKGLTTWLTTGEGKRYREHVCVSKSPNPGFRKFKDDMDPRATIFPYESTLAELIADNGLMVDGELEIVQISTPEEFDAAGVGTNFIGEVAWLPVGVTLTSPPDAHRRFKCKAADLGSPCPPSCPSEPFTFKIKGTKPRPECQGR